MLTFFMLNQIMIYYKDKRKILTIKVTYIQFFRKVIQKFYITIQKILLVLPFKI